MKKLRKALSLLFLGLIAGTTAAQAQPTYPTGDILIGFTVGSGNDEIYDLGQESAITNGQSWNLAFLLTAYGNYSGVSWGVIGNGPNSGSPRTLWTTTAVGVTPAAITGVQAFSTLNTAVGTMYQSFTNAGPGNWCTVAYNYGYPAIVSWNESTTGNSPSGTSSYINKYEDPNVTGVTSAAFGQVLNNGSTPTPLGTFTLASNGTVTFHIPVPQITSATESAGQFSLSGVDGVPTAQYRILASTNLALSSSWTTVYTGNFLSNGSFSYTTGVTNPASFFRVVTP